jgi:hypothetical protein
MDYHQSAPVRLQRPGPPRFVAGQRAVVQYERARMEGLDTVVLTDEDGTSTVRGLADGEEVEMVAWRLAWREGPRMLYQVRCVGDDTVGWIQAELLHALPEPGAPTRGGGQDRRRNKGRAPMRPMPTPGPSGTADVEPVAAAPGPAERPVICPVCREEVHPYNLWSDAKKQVIGCYLCHGRRKD